MRLLCLIIVGMVLTSCDVKILKSNESSAPNSVTYDYGDASDTDDFHSDDQSESMKEKVEEKIEERKQESSQRDLTEVTYYTFSQFNKDFKKNWEKYKDEFSEEKVVAKAIDQELKRLLTDNLIDLNYNASDFKLDLVQLKSCLKSGEKLSKCFFDSLEINSVWETL